MWVFVARLYEVFCCAVVEKCLQRVVLIQCVFFFSLRLHLHRYARIYDGPERLHTIALQSTCVCEKCRNRKPHYLEVQPQGIFFFFFRFEPVNGNINNQFSALHRFSQGSRRCRSKVVTDFVDGQNRIVKVSDETHNHPVNIKRRKLKSDNSETQSRSAMSSKRFIDEPKFYESNVEYISDDGDEQE